MYPLGQPTADVPPVSELRERMYPGGNFPSWPNSIPTEREFCQMIEPYRIHLPCSELYRYAQPPGWIDLPETGSLPPGW